MRCLLLAAVPVGLGAQVPAIGAGGKTVQAMPVRVVATTRASTTRQQGAFTLDDVNWTCSGTRCVAAAAPLSAMAACRNLVREVGTLRSFKIANRALPEADLRYCHNLTPVADATRPGMKQSPVPTKQRPTPDPASSSTRHLRRPVTADDYVRRAEPLPDAPDRAKVLPRMPSTNTPASPPASASFVPVLIHTPSLTLTGTGVAEVRFRFTPVAVRTPQLILNATGAAEVTFKFTPVVVRTGRLTLTGTGRVE